MHWPNEWQIVTNLNYQQTHQTSMSCFQTLNQFKYYNKCGDYNSEAIYVEEIKTINFNFNFVEFIEQ